jgi:hypothetical protein
MRVNTGKGQRHIDDGMVMKPGIILLRQAVNLGDTLL